MSSSPVNTPDFLVPDSSPRDSPLAGPSSPHEESCLPTQIAHNALGAGASRGASTGISGNLKGRFSNIANKVRHSFLFKLGEHLHGESRYFFLLTVAEGLIQQGQYEEARLYLNEVEKCDSLAFKFRACAGFSALPGGKEEAIKQFRTLFEEALKTREPPHPLSYPGFPRDPLFFGNLPSHPSSVSDWSETNNLFEISSEEETSASETPLEAPVAKPPPPTLSFPPVFHPPVLLPISIPGQKTPPPVLTPPPSPPPKPYESILNHSCRRAMIESALICGVGEEIFEFVQGVYSSMRDLVYIALELRMKGIAFKAMERTSSILDLVDYDFEELVETFLKLDETDKLHTLIDRGLKEAEEKKDMKAHEHLVRGLIRLHRREDALDSLNRLYRSEIDFEAIKESYYTLFKAMIAAGEGEKACDPAYYCGDDFLKAAACFLYSKHLAEYGKAAEARHKIWEAVTLVRETPFYGHRTIEDEAIKEVVLCLAKAGDFKHAEELINKLDWGEQEPLTEKIEGEKLIQGLNYSPYIKSETYLDCAFSFIEKGELPKAEYALIYLATPKDLLQVVHPPFSYGILLATVKCAEKAKRSDVIERSLEQVQRRASKERVPSSEKEFFFKLLLKMPLKEAETTLKNYIKHCNSRECSSLLEVANFALKIGSLKEAYRALRKMDYLFIFPYRDTLLKFIQKVSEATHSR